MYRCKHFIIEELVPRWFYERVMELPLHPDMAVKLLWSMFEEKMLRGIDWIKEEYSPHHPVTINNWKWGGEREWSGLRTTESEYYREGSQHSIANAFDLIFKNTTAAKIRLDLMSRSDVPFSRVEGGVSWLHVDNHPTDLPKGLVYCFNP